VAVLSPRPWVAEGRRAGPERWVAGGGGEAEGVSELRAVGGARRRWVTDGAAATGHTFGLSRDRSRLKPVLHRGLMASVLWEI
jgi:hypothetical protein